MNENNKKRQKLTALLVLLTFIFTSILPSNIIGWNSRAEAAMINYQPNSRNNISVMVEDENRQRISNATLTVTRNGNNYGVQNIGNGEYQFTREDGYYYSNTDYTIQV